MQQIDYDYMQALVRFYGQCEAILAPNTFWSDTEKCGRILLRLNDLNQAHAQWLAMWKKPASEPALATAKTGGGS